MSLASRREYLIKMKPRYLKASTEKKTQMLDEYCAATKMNRKYITRLLSPRLSLKEKKERVKKKRAPLYGKDVIAALKKIWEVLDVPCAERLKPMIGEMLVQLIRWNEISVSEEVKKKLLRISISTIRRKLSSVQTDVVRKICGTTKPGSLLKSQIPIRTSSWEEARPGYCELDTVAHCGSSLSGDFAYTLNITDMLTGWSEEEAFIGKAQSRVIPALDRMNKRMPFPIKGADPDNGSEFINAAMINYCMENRIEFTRGRPYKKNDNAHIEQKNWTHVRKVFGYVRVEEQQIVDLMNDLYRHEIGLYKNFYQPVMKLVDKKRVGKHKQRIKRVYDIPKTPYQRTLDCPDVSQEAKTKLRTTYEKLNPAELKRSIEKKILAFGRAVAKHRKEI